MPKPHIAQFTIPLHGEPRKFLVKAANAYRVLYDVRGPYHAPSPGERPVPTYVIPDCCMSPEGFAARTGWRASK